MGVDAFEPPAEPATAVGFGRFRFDPARVELTREGVPVPLRPKTYALLGLFLASPGRVLGKTELLATLWPKVVVTEDSLVQCVGELRAALCEDGARFVVTVPRRGYRFDAELRADAAPAAAAAPPAHAAAHDDGMAASAAGATPQERAGLRAGTRPLAALLVLVVVAALGALLATRGPAQAGMDQALAQRRSVALLPLRASGADAGPEFADAVAEVLIGDIARLPGTLVIARASAAAAAARESDTRRIGQMLGVAYLLAGTLAREGETVELALQFVAADTGAVLWSERWRHASADPQAWPREVSLRVARALDLRLTHAAAGRDAAGRARAAGVVDAMAQADALLRRSTAPGDVREARARFEAALAADPRASHAWAGLALSLLSEVQGRWGDDPARQTARPAAAVEAALALDPESALAHYARGHLLMVQGDVEAALAAYRQVLARNPSDAWAHARVGAALLALGRFDQVEAPVARARQLSPLEGTQVAFGQVTAATADFHRGRDDAAYQRCREAALANPQNASAWAMMAAIDALHGRPEAAAKAMARLRQLRPQWTVAGVRALQGTTAPALAAGQSRYVEGLAAAGLPPG